MKLATGVGDTLGLRAVYIAKLAKQASQTS